MFRDDQLTKAERLGIQLRAVPDEFTNTFGGGGGCMRLITVKFRSRVVSSGWRNFHSFISGNRTLASSALAVKIHKMVMQGVK